MIQGTRCAQDVSTARVRGESSHILLNLGVDTASGSASPQGLPKKPTHGATCFFTIAHLIACVIWLWFRVWYFLVACCGHTSPYCIILHQTLSMALRWRRRGRPRRLPFACRPRRKLVLTRREGWIIQNGFPMLPGSWFLMFLVELGWHYFLLSVGYLRLCKQNV